MSGRRFAARNNSQRVQPVHGHYGPAPARENRGRRANRGDSRDRPRRQGDADGPPRGGYAAMAASPPRGDRSVRRKRAAEDDWETPPPRIGAHLAPWEIEALRWTAKRAERRTSYERRERLAFE
ncbi:unnamed protein product, partial [Pylaiella littoralis]